MSIKSWVIKKQLKREMQNMQNLINGKKTYVTGGLMIMYAVAGFFLNHMSADEAIKLALEGFSVITLRSGIAAK